MIDPLAIVIAYLATALPSLEERVANKHRFGDAWKTGQAAMTVNLDDGEPDLYAPIHKPRLEMRVYGKNRPAITATWMELVALSRSTTRVAVTIIGGGGLLHYFNQASSLSLLYDEELDIDYGMAFFDAMISEEAV